MKCKNCGVELIRVSDKWAFATQGRDLSKWTHSMMRMWSSAPYTPCRNPELSEADNVLFILSQYE